MSDKTGFIKNAHRFDPYKSFKFRIIMDKKPVLGVSKVSALTRTTEPIPWREGGSNSYDYKAVGKTSYSAITMERGVTHDPDFEKWAMSVHEYGGDGAMDLKNFKKDLTLELMNERGQPIYRYYLHNCWVSEYTAMPDFDANANAIAIETIKFEIEGFSRDLDTTEPDETGAVPNPS